MYLGGNRRQVPLKTSWMHHVLERQISMTCHYRCNGVVMEYTIGSLSELVVRWPHQIRKIHQFLQDCKTSKEITFSQICTKQYGFSLKLHCILAFSSLKNLQTSSQLRDMLFIANMLTNLSNETHFHENLRCDFPTSSIAVQVSKILAYAVILIFGLLGNAFVIVIVYKRQELRNTINYFIVNMAVSDFVFPLTTIPLSIILRIGL